MKPLAIGMLVIGMLGVGIGAALLSRPGKIQDRLVTSGDRLVTARFCEFYYDWRATQAGDRGVPAVDLICFDAQEDRP
jgi:hypothetical protein